MADEVRTQRALGASIQRYRRQRGWSQEALAEKLGLSVTYIGMLERAERMPALPVLIDMAELFGSSLDQLVGRGVPDEGWMQEAVALMMSVPAASRPTVAAMLRGLAGATAEPPGPPEPAG